MRKRLVAVVTGTRAELGLLTPIMRAVQAHPRLALRVVAAGQHFVANRGNTWREIPKAGFRIAAEVRAPEPTGAPAWMGEALGKMTMGFSRVFARMRPDWLLVLGDRAEPLAAALAATELGGIAVAHLHGGEVTGHRLDDQGRRLLSALAHLHLPATPLSERRLKAMGEAPWRIRRVGAPGLDSILGKSATRRRDILRRYGLSETEPFVILAQHAVPHQSDQAAAQVRETLKALRQTGLPVIATASNTDRGGAAILRELKRAAAAGRLRLVPSLPHADYLALLHHAAALVGNSSSGIIEAPAFGTPAVDIGIRQAGRERSAHVISAPHRAEAIAAAVRRAASEPFRRQVARIPSPYGDGKTTPKVVRLLASLPLNDRLLDKSEAPHA